MACFDMLPPEAGESRRTIERKHLSDENAGRDEKGERMTEISSRAKWRRKEARREARPPRILHVVHAMVVGGAERVITDLIRANRNPKLETHVCCLYREGAMAQALRDEGVPVHVLGRHPGWDPRVWAGLHMLIRRERFDIIHAHQYTPWLYSSLAFPFSGASRLILTGHGRLLPDLRTSRRVMISRSLHPLSHALVAVSRATREAMIRIDGFPAQRVQVIYNGIDPTPYQRAIRRGEITAEFGWTDPRIRIIGLVSRFHSIKNIPLLVRAFADVLRERTHTRLLLVGDGPERDSVEKLCHAMGIEKAVHFTGFRRDVPSLLKAMDVFALPSLTEGISIALLEAMASGLPIVATRVGGTPELVIHSENGFLTGYNDQEEFTRRLLQLLTHPELRQSMGDAGQRRLHRLFTRSRMADAYERLYRSPESRL